MRIPSHLAIIMGVTWCALGSVGSAQLSALAIDPRVVVLSPQRPTGRVTVFNPRMTAAEFSVSLRYGVVTTNASGQPIVTLDSVNAGMAMNDATPWITAFPAKFILNPGSSQVIRLFAQPPQHTPDGEYWTRLVVRARELVPPLAPRAATDSGTRIGISLETSTILPLFYRSGTVNTGIAIDSLFAARDGDSLVVHATLRRTGNAAYLGVATLSLEDAETAGTHLAHHPAITTHKRVAVYSTIAPQWRIPLDKPARNGTQRRLSLVLSTERPDAPPGTILRAPTVGHSLDVTIR